ncbi:Kelch motif protein [compost metagenome]
MLELLLSSGHNRSAAADDSDLPFPEGTPFKGVVPSVSFIAGDALAAAIGLDAGTVMNKDAGWLHFIEPTGLELYVAKKPLRHSIAWETVQAATDNGSKEITIGGEVYVIRMLTGVIAAGDTQPANPDNAGGEWNRYMYNVYDQTDRAGIPTALLWGNYTKVMLGIATFDGDLTDGVMSLCQDRVSGGYLLRGNDWTGASGGNQHIKGIWYQPPGSTQNYYGWRPALIKKSTIPPTPYKGIVAEADLITGAALAAAIGISGGTPFVEAGQGWLKFQDNGKTFYIAKKPVRTALLIEELSAIGAVNGTKTITIGGKIYKVRLMTGGDADPANNGGGEYNNYFARVTTEYAGIGERWGNLTTADIAWYGGASSGELTLCQEQWAGNGPLTRGYPGFYGLWYQAAAATHGGYGWRPVLELVGDAPVITDTWVKLGDLPAGINGATASIVGNKMYVFGGQDAGFVVKGTMYEVDLTTGAVVTKAADVPRRYHQAAVINGKVYIYGGYTTAYDGGVRIYDPVANTWSAGTAGLATDRHAGLAYNNLFYNFGGGNGVTQARSYNPAGNAWTNYNPTGVTVPIPYLGSADLLGTNVYTHTGYNAQKEFRKIDMVANVVSALANPPHGSYGHAHGSAQGGIYLFGGTVDVAGKDLVVTRYDINTDSWSYLGAIPYTVGERAASAQDATNIYLVGGVGSPTAIWKYTP